MNSYSVGRHTHDGRGGENIGTKKHEMQEICLMSKQNSNMHKVSTVTINVVVVGNNTVFLALKC